MSIRRKGRYWEVLDNQEILVCLAVYRKGACEVVRRLEATAPRPVQAESADPEPPHEPR